MSDETNSGDCNTGDRNTGYCNTGNRNSGHYNTGDRNTGNSNTGNSNTGNRNSGHYNSGDRNTGDSNSGDRNTGDSNSGHYNSGDRNSGFFCTDTPVPTFFDKPTSGLSWRDSCDLIPYIDLEIGVEFVPSCEMTDQEKDDHPTHKTIGGYLKEHALPMNESFPKAWEKMGEETKQRFKDLPNFDAGKFFEITGVDVRKPNTRTITIDGKEIEISAESFAELKKQLAD